MKKTIILLSLILCMNVTYSQQEVELKSIKTDLKNAAVGFVINYLADYGGISSLHSFKKGFVTYTPEIVTKAGTSDAFSQIDLKLTGFFLFGRLTNVAGVKTINSAKTMHAFPISAGFETSSDFNFLNTIAEVGWEPIYNLPGNATVGDFFKHTQFAIFLQGGYKSKLDTANISKAAGGKLDESAEKLNHGVLRTKASFKIDTKNFFQIPGSSLGFGIIGKANYWFDFLNAQSYYNIEGKFRIYLAKNKFVDLTYEKGSGAPNFNQGDQFGLGLSVGF